MLRICYDVRLEAKDPLNGDILVDSEDGTWLQRFTREEKNSTCEGRRRNYWWVMRLALPDGIMPAG